MAAFARWGAWFVAWGVGVLGWLPASGGEPDPQLCVECHLKTTPSIVAQWRASGHATAKPEVTCLSCHKAREGEPDAYKHHDAFIATIVSPKRCEPCHAEQVKQFAASRHAGAANVTGASVVLAEVLEGHAASVSGCQQCHGSTVVAGKEGKLDEKTWPNAGVGRVNPDGSKGCCSACHARHSFSRAQARRPENCGRCHLGPDHPQFEVYKESKHGVLFDAHDQELKLDSKKWVVGVDYTAAPTCATCHLSATPKQPFSHDVGLRLSWNLRDPISTRQTGSAKKRMSMQEVCFNCHGTKYVESFYKQFDGVVRLYNEKFAKPAKAIMDELAADKLLTPTPFDEPIEWRYYELWHHQGRRARHGAAMMGPDYVHWHGFYDVARTFYMEFLPEAERLKKGVTDKVRASDDHAWLKGLSKEELDKVEKAYKGQ